MRAQRAAVLGVVMVFVSMLEYYQTSKILSSKFVRAERVAVMSKYVKSPKGVSWGHFKEWEPKQAKSGARTKLSSTQVCEPQVIPWGRAKNLATAPRSQGPAE